MKFSLETLCSQFIEARDVIRDTFKWDSSYLPPVCANLFCAAGAVPDADRLRACRDLINQKTGIFSSFRGHIRVPLACLLSMEDRPEEKFDRAKEVYQLLRERFSASDYLALASFLLAEYGCTEDQIARGKRIYRLMKDEHPLLTSSEDSIFALMMAWSDRPDEELISDMETCYRLLKERFHDSNCVQTMAQILAMEPADTRTKCEKVFTLYDQIEQTIGKYGKHHELATLAACAMLDEDPAAMAEDMKDIDAFLDQQKGYGFFGIDRKTRLMHAAMIVSDEYMPRGEVDTAALSGTIAMLIAQQIATCAIIASSTAASAASSSHS